MADWKLTARDRGQISICGEPWEQQSKIISGAGSTVRFRQATGLRSIMCNYSLSFEGQELLFSKKYIAKEVIMSIESAKAFVEKMRKDSEFKNQILTAESAAKRKEIIKNSGFEFEKLHLDSLVSKLTPEERNALMVL